MSSHLASVWDGSAQKHSPPANFVSCHCAVNCVEHHNRSISHHPTASLPLPPATTSAFNYLRWAASVASTSHSQIYFNDFSSSCLIWCDCWVYVYHCSVFASRHTSDFKSFGKVFNLTRKALWLRLSREVGKSLGMGVTRHSDQWNSHSHSFALVGSIKVGVWVGVLDWELEVAWLTQNASWALAPCEESDSDALKCELCGDFRVIVMY